MLKEELYNQRKTIINLLLIKEDQESLFLAYLLYDLLTNDHNQNVDTNEKYSFQEGIRHIVGEKDELNIYNMWWLENS